MCCGCTGWQQRGLLPQRLKLQLGCPVPSRAERRGCMRSGQVLLQLRRCLLLLVLVLPVLETAAAWCACTCCMRPPASVGLSCWQLAVVKCCLGPACLTKPICWQPWHQLCSLPYLIQKAFQPGPSRTLPAILALVP